MISEILLAQATLSPLVIFGIHCLSYRVFGLAKRAFSPQFFLIKLILFLNLPMLAMVWTIAVTEKRNYNYQEIIAMMIFMSLVFNGFGYAYFHFFNMSETSRRIHILTLIREGCLMDQEIQTNYMPEEMVHQRLRRLGEMKEVVEGDDGRYRVTGGFLLSVARLMRRCRESIGFGRDRRS